MREATVVAKFGGTSVGSPERIREVARIVSGIFQRHRRLVVVVSAMAGETDRLLKLGRALNASQSGLALRELDALVATGESVSASLLALAIQERGLPARSFTAHQVVIATDGRFQRARIRKVDSAPLLNALDHGMICVVTGFQGTDDAGNLVTLGRGGSDTSAVAVAIALRASVCEIYTDVEGVYTADPRLVPDARKLDRISYEEMMELASTGAKVLQIRSVELGMKHDLNLCVRSSFSNSPGTMILNMNEHLEEPVVTGLSHHLGQAKVSVRGLQAAGESLTAVLGPLAQEDISVDFITQNVGSDGRMSIAFTVEESLLERALGSLERDLRPSATPDLTMEMERNLAKVSAVGIGMRTHAGVALRFFECLTRHGIGIHMALSTEIKVSALVASADCERALRLLHDEFFGPGDEGSGAGQAA